MNARPLAARVPSTVLLVVLLMVAVVVLIRLAASSSMSEVARSPRLLAAAPAGVLVAYGLISTHLTPGRRLEWFLGGDHVRHLIFVADLQAGGNLTYAQEAYPRGWHVLLAMLWSAEGAGRFDVDGLVHLATLMSAATWALFALLTLSTGHMGFTLASRLGAEARSAGWCGLVAGAFTLLPSIFLNYLGLGFENSILAALVLVVSARELLVRAGSLTSVLVTACGVLLMAHAWQVLLPGAVLALSVAVVVALRSWAPRRLLSCCGCLVGSVAAGWPGMAAVVQHVGIGHATDAGVVAPIPWVLLPCALGAAVHLGVVRRQDRMLLAYCLMVVGTALVGVGLAIVVGIPLTQYYPAKVLWSSAVLGFPLVAFDAIWLVSVLHHGPRAVILVRAAVRAGLALAVLYAAASPASLALALWSTGSGARILSAITAPAAPQAQVVWLRGPELDDVVTRILLDFYRVETTTERTPQGGLSISEECALLRASAQPTVLSSAPVAEVQHRYDCVPVVRVVPVR